MLTLRRLHRLHLHPIDLDLHDGECVALSGHSGCGKSVLLRALADLDPHEGEALLDGQSCASMPAPQWRKQVTYVPAESGWWDDMVRPHFLPEQDLATLLPRVGLAAAAADWPVARLSTGERQRMALLRALRPGVRVLLLDEPTSGLDPDSVLKVEALLQEQLAQGMSILMVTHSPEQAMRLAHRRFRMQDGCLQELST
ncbi:ATP-binding cassette domain-containing protein [Aquabacterium sp.]|uniref:ABC transporter ATP-binding protein n=1 Tax=Aquabacterium sp. TaxID=1872578 RepID=UPI0035AEC4FB